MARSRKAPEPPPTLEERFSWCAPCFREKVHRLAAHAGKTWQEVYTLWREYCGLCHDQSSIFSEFVEWYKDRLGVVPAKALAVCEA